ncbi:hypothetical protein PTKIN_Ptkin04bG0104800 [Pterospermum kingtungense]
MPLSLRLVLMIVLDTEKQQEEVVLPNGIRYYELRVGEGGCPSPWDGELVVIDVKGKMEGSWGKWTLQQGNV